MAFIKVDADTWIEYDAISGRTKLISKGETQKTLDDITARLSSLPTIDDVYLLEWARQNLSKNEVIAEKGNLEKHKVELEDLLTNLV